MKNLLTLICSLAVTIGLAQKETRVTTEVLKATVFTSGAQLEHQTTVQLKEGRQLVIFEKLTDYLDPSSVQLKCSSNATIISVRTRKNFDDKVMAQNDIAEKNAKKKELQLQERKLRDEYKVLLLDEQLLQKNNTLGSQQQGVKISELKEASTFYHTKMTEILTRKSQLETEIESSVRKQNILEQEISTRKSLPVINYTEIEVELELTATGSVSFTFNYITDRAFWTPYYDMRSNGIGAPVALEAKGKINQSTGIDWKNIQLTLSTNDPYDNTQEPILNPWNLDYYTPLPQKQSVYRETPAHNYVGETIHGEVTDIVTGEPLAFAKLTFSNAPQMVITTDAVGKFQFQVPLDVANFSITYLGYQNQFQSINAPYIKVQMYPEAIAMEKLEEFGYGMDGGAGTGIVSRITSTNSATAYDMITIESSKKRSKSNRKSKNAEEQKGDSYSSDSSEFEMDYYGTMTERELRVEYTIENPFTIPSDNADHRVSIATFQMPATYEYHAVPKLDKEVYLVAQISGWEKMNLLNGEANLYFDGTYIGKTYIDVNSTKDTLSFSLGKDRKIQIERVKVAELSKTKSSGSRTKYEVTWEYAVRNNGPTLVPIVLKDQFPVSINNDIKVKTGGYDGATLDENTHILTWKFDLGRGESKKFRFDFSVDYGKNGQVFLE